MPQPISFDEVAQTAPKKPQTITFDELMEQRSAAAKPIRDASGELNRGPPGEGGDFIVRDGQLMLAPRIQPAENANFGAAFKSSFVEDPETKQRLVSESLGVDRSRVGLDNGRPVYADDQNQLRYASSGLAQFGGSALANAPEAAGAIVGGMSASPVAGSALGVMGARGLKRATAGLVFDEPQTISGNLKDIAGEGALDLVAGGIGKGIARAGDRGLRRTIDFTPDNVKTAQQARDYIKQSTGIDVDLAQASGNRKLIAIRGYAARFPGKSAELVQASDELAEGQLDSAVNRVMDLVANATPMEIGAARGVNAAQMAITAAKAKRDKAVEPFYEQARKVVLGADVVETLSKDPLIARAARRVKSDPVYQRKLADLPENSVGYWQQVKRNLDAGYETAASSGNKTVASEYADAARQLNQKLGAASPEYALANKHFEEQTRKIIEPLENSAVGILANIKNPRLATAAAKILGDKNISVDQIVWARKQIAKQDPEAWNGLVRQYLGGAWNKALKETQTGTAVNPAGKLRQALIGTPQDKLRMQAMLPPGAVQAFDDLMMAAESLARTPIAGSNTMRDTEIKDQLKGAGATTLRWLTSPRQSLVDAAEQRALEQNTVAITEAILDPTKQKQLKAVVRMAPSTRKAIVLTSILGGQAVQPAAARGETRTPPSMQPQQQ